MSDFTGLTIGRYHILEKLGQGGMAIVYKAYDTRLERDVAIKFIRMELVASAFTGEVLTRFEREAKALARLTHPNIVSVLDYGEHEGTPYLVMVYLGGGTLKSRLTGRPMPCKDAARLLLPIAHALEYAHANNIIHRDIKPANILLTQSGQPMLTDFGIAKILDSNDATALTGTGIGIGTPEYMSPEQGQGRKDIDRRTDIYALGVVFYEMVTGRKPFQADTPMAVIFKHISEPLPRPRLYIPDLPDEAERIIFSAMAKNRNDRYPEMAPFIQGLERLGFETSKAPAVRPPLVPMLNPQPLPAQQLTRSSPVQTQVSAKSPVSRRAFIAGAVVGGIALVAACGGLTVVGIQLLTKKVTPVSALPTKKTATQTSETTQAPEPTKVNPTQIAEPTKLLEPTRSSPTQTIVPSASETLPFAPTVAAGELGSPDKPITITFVPSGDTGKITRAGNDIADYLNKMTNLSFKIEVGTTFTASIEAMGTERAQVGFLNTFSVLLAQQKYGVIPALAVMRMYTSNAVDTDKDLAGQLQPFYKGQFIANVDSGIKTFTDLKGKTFCFVDPNSTIGYIIPRIILKANGVDPDKDLKATMNAGSHPNVAIAVYKRDCDAGVTFIDVLTDAATNLKEKYPDIATRVTPFAVTDRIPNDGVQFIKTLDPKLQSNITDALLAMAKDTDGNTVLRGLYAINDFQKIDASFYQGLADLLGKAGVDPASLVK